ncbi:MAG: hypothetical protein HVN35_06915 [Methanobacteriaceae archaeon]|nr:hypothetical protein [Methanobacteriaceae archaeon]
MVKNIPSVRFPQRKNQFKKMMDKVRSRVVPSKKSEQILWLKHSAQSTRTAKWIFKDPRRWERFLEEYHEEFNKKIKLMDEIRDKKIEYEKNYWVN